MRFNGIDPRSVHPALSVNKEIYPGMARRKVTSVRGNDGETIAGYLEERSEAVIRMNIGAKTRTEAYEARAAMAEWAASSGEKTAPLEPTHWPGKAYDAILASISEPEFVFGHATVEVTFLLPRGHAYDIKTSRASGAGEATMTIDGSSKVRPVIRQTMAEKTSSLTWSADGKPFLRLADGYAPEAGTVIEADFAQGSLTANGEHIEKYIDYTLTTWQPGLTPGRHTVTSSDGGMLEARWHDEWI